MVYITGDTHGEWARFTELATQGEVNWSAEDYLIVCGDFGYVKPENRELLDKLESEKKYTIDKKTFFVFGGGYSRDRWSR